MKKVIFFALWPLLFMGNAQAQFVDFYDSLFEEAVKIHLAIPPGGVVPQHQADTLTYLDLSGMDITEVFDVIHFPNLKELDLSYNRLEDISQLSVLGNLERLWLNNNRLAEINGLGLSHSHHMSVNVADNYISDFSFPLRSSTTYIRIYGMDAQAPISQRDTVRTYINQVLVNTLDSATNLFHIQCSAWSTNGATATIDLGDGTVFYGNPNEVYHNVYHRYCTPGTYVVTLEINGQHLRDTVDIFAAPDANLFAADSNYPILCKAGSLTLQSSPTGGDDLNFNWERDGVLLTHTDSVFVISEAGFYRVNVSDTSGCTFTDTLTIFPSSFTPQDSIVQISCYGQTDGALFIDSVTGGVAPYSLRWLDNDSSFPSRHNLAEGIYSLEITDSLGCQDTIAYSIIEPDSLYASVDVVAVRCHGDNDGALNAATFGGSGVYTWEWYKDGALFATTEDLDSITSGVYTLILQDSEGCIFTDSWLVPEPDVMEITGTVKHSSCAGADNGMIEPIITGGAPPYTFLWNTGQTTRIIPNLAPTNLEPYEIMVKDTNNCVVYMQFTVNEPTGTPALSYDKVIYCVNEPNPTPTLENVWNGQFVPTGTGLDIDPSTGEINLSNSALGTYTVNYVSDIAMCNTASFEVTIKAEESPAFTFPTRFCKQNGGTFTPQIQGTPDGRFSGTALPDSLTGEVAIDSLAPGLYTLIYTTPDCHEVKTLEIEIYDEPTANIFQSDTVVCEGTAINLQAEASVGTYRWELNGQVIGDQQTLNHSFDTPGSYRIRLTSETGNGFCTKTEQITVRVSEYPTVDLGADIFSCEAPVTLDAGNAGMTYLWSSGETSQTLTVTESGTYSVIVTNADGCATTSAEINVTITKPQIAVFKENISCLGQQDGRIQIEVTEGTPPYKIRWNDLATDSVLSREHLPAATYVVTVEDSKGCITTAEVEIVEPEAIIATAEIRKPTCFEAANGFIILDIQGGTIAPGSDYIVNWSNGMTGKRIDGLGNGIYEAEISDDNGCLGYWRGTIDEVDSMRIELVLTNASCEGATDGSAVFNISGGQPPYTVTYSKPEFNGLANHNLAPTADVPVHAWVEDASGHCRQEFTFEIGVAPTSILDFSIQDTAVCVGETTQLNFRYTGEIYPYNIVLEDNGQEVQLEGADSTLTHEVTITEDREFVLKAVRYGSGCEGIASGEAKVTAKPLPELANPLISHANCGNEDGQIAIDTEEIEAGTAPFEFSLDGENFTTDSLFTDLEPGEYTLYIREADGCVFVFPAPILIQDKPCSVKDIPTLITPNGDGKNDAWIVDDLRAYPQCVVRIYTREGLLIHESEPGYTTPWEANGHPFGTYFYTIDLRNGEIVKGFISVVR